MWWCVGGGGGGGVGGGGATIAGPLGLTALASPKGPLPCHTRSKPLPPVPSRFAIALAPPSDPPDDDDGPEDGDDDAGEYVDV